MLFGRRTDQEPLPNDVLRRLENLEHRFVLLQQEWTQTLDQVTRYFARHRKRQSDELKAAQTAQEGESQGLPLTGGRSLPLGVLRRRGGG